MLPNFCTELSHALTASRNNKHLLTECEVCTGKCYGALFSGEYIFN